MVPKGIATAQGSGNAEQSLVRALFAPSELSPRAMALVFGPEGEMIRKELRSHIDDALDALGYRERGLLEMLHGLGDGHAYSPAEVAAVFGIPPDRVDATHALALAALRSQMGSLRRFINGLALS